MLLFAAKGCVLLVWLWSCLGYTQKVTLENFYKSLGQSKVRRAAKEFREAAIREPAGYWDEVLESVNVHTDLFARKDVVINKENDTTINDSFEDPVYGIRNSISATLLGHDDEDNVDAREEELRRILGYLEDERRLHVAEKIWVTHFVTFYIGYKRYKLQKKIFEITEQVYNNAARGLKVEVTTRNFFKMIKTRYLLRKARVQNAKKTLGALLERISFFYKTRITKPEQISIKPITSSFYEQALKKNFLKFYEKRNPSFVYLKFKKLFIDYQKKEKERDVVPLVTVSAGHQSTDRELSGVATKQNNLFFSLNLRYTWLDKDESVEGFEALVKEAVLYDEMIKRNRQSFVKMVNVTINQLRGIQSNYYEVSKVAEPFLKASLAKGLKVYRPNLTEWVQFANFVDSYEGFFEEKLKSEEQFLVNFYNLHYESGLLSTNSIDIDVTKYEN